MVVMPQRAKTIAPYGKWDSVISSDLLTKKNVSFGEVDVVLTTDSYAEIVFTEGRPSEGGRAALLKKRISLDFSTSSFTSDADGADLTKGQYNARSGVHEYGGGALATCKVTNRVYFTDQQSRNVFEVRQDGTIEALLPENMAHRFADFAPHPSLPFVVSVLEDHTNDTPAGVISKLVCIDKREKKVYDLASGYDFYTCPRLSPNGKYIAWVCWNHPSMPFWATEIWVGKLLAENEGEEPCIVGAKKLAGNNTNEVAHNPLWLDEHTLTFTRDKTGFANPFSAHISEDLSGTIVIKRVQPLLEEPVASDFAEPAWTLNNSTSTRLSSEWIAYITTKNAFSSVALLHVPTGYLKQLDTPFVKMSQLRAISKSAVAFVGSTEVMPSSLVAMDLSHTLHCNQSAAQPKWVILKASSSVTTDGTVPEGYVGIAQRIEFPTELPDKSIASAHALFFPPRNPCFAAPSGTSPPCIVKIHGGPTAFAYPGADLSLSYWTSRGYAICHVQYGGSVSFGRDYMERLMKQWGVVDVRDAAAAAAFIGSSERANPEKSARRIVSDGHAQLVSLEEEVLTGGGVKFTVHRKPTWTQSLIDMFSSGLFGIAACMIPNVDVRWGLFVGGFAWVLRTISHVQQESVTALPGVGIQLETIRGLRTPRLIKTSAKRKLIPRDSILDIITSEAFQHWRVIDYVAVATRMSRMVRMEEGNDQGGKLEVVFPHLLPRLPVVEHVFTSIYQAIFQHKKALPPSLRGQPLVDPNKIAISGSSAGGFTVLASLCLYPNMFKAGTSLYGVSNIADLAEESHKFESEYTNRLMGGTPEEVPRVYHDRSPLYMADRIQAPVILMQGDIDKVVPPEQSKAIYDVLQKRGVQTKYILFEGEGHGFRKAENIRRAIQEEETWYKSCFNL